MCYMKMIISLYNLLFSERSLSSANKGSYYSDEPCSSKTLLHKSTEDRATSSRESRKRLPDPSEDMSYERSKRSKHRDSAQGSSHSRKKDSTLSAEESSQREISRERLWVAPNLKVRMVDTKFKGGKYYNNKVSIECMIIL